MRCHIITAPGALITVLSGGYLDIDSSTVTACNVMWRGIKVEDYGELVVQEGSSVEDADTVVVANDKAKVKLDNACLRNFVIGVYVPVKPSGYSGAALTVRKTVFEFSAFKADYSGQASHGSKPECGIALNDWYGTIGTYALPSSQNRFLNLNCGIAGWRSNVRVKNCYFKQIQPDSFYPKQYNGSAVFSKGDVNNFSYGKLIVDTVQANWKTMVDCTRGITTVYSDLQARYLKMDSMTVGMFTTLSKGYFDTEIEYCSIKAKQTGINMTVNAGARRMLVNGNSIYMSNANTTNMTAINIGEVNKMGLGNYTITNNSLYLYDANYGIRMANVYKPIVAHNYIEQNNQQNSLAAVGINAVNSDSTTVTCNQVRTEHIGNTYTEGLRYSICKGGLIACNSMDTTGYAFKFGGNCMGTQLKGNTMRNNLLGLYINNTGLMGVQPNHGNKFIDYRDTVGAYNANLSPFGLSGSEFRLKNGTVMGSIYYPVLAQQNLGWFVDNQTSNPYQCGAACYDMLTDINNNMLYMFIVNDSALTDVFIPEGKSMARQYLYEILDNDSNLRNVNPFFHDFYLQMQNEAEGMLREVNRNLENYDKMDSTFVPLLNTIDSLLNDIEFKMANRDSICAVHPNWDCDSLRSKWKYDAGILNDARSDIIMQYEAITSGKLDEADLINNLVDPKEQPDRNSQTMNELLALLLERNFDNVNDYYSLLLSIAEQCPYYGGEAVYRARAAIALVNDSIEYNDDVNCLMLGYYRQAGVESTIKNELIEVKPNPANEYVSIKVNCNEDEMFVAEINNAVGQTVLQTKLQCNIENVVKINQFQQGVYTVRIKTSFKTQSFKLTIMR
jgi:hypothetical protein